MMNSKSFLILKLLKIFIISQVLVIQAALAADEAFDLLQANVFSQLSATPFRMQIRANRTFPISSAEAEPGPEYYREYNGAYHSFQKEFGMSRGDPDIGFIIEFDQSRGAIRVYHLVELDKVPGKQAQWTPSGPILDQKTLGVIVEEFQFRDGKQVIFRMKLAALQSEVPYSTLKESTIPQLERLWKEVAQKNNAMNPHLAPNSWAAGDITPLRALLVRGALGCRENLESSTPTPSKNLLNE